MKSKVINDHTIKYFSNDDFAIIGDGLKLYQNTACYWDQYFCGKWVTDEKFDAALELVKELGKDKYVFIDHHVCTNKYFKSLVQSKL